MRDPGRQIPDPDSPSRRHLISHGLPPAAMCPESAVTAAAGVTERPGIQHQCAPIMVCGGSGEALRPEQQHVRRLGERLRVRPDDCACPGLHSMPLATARREPARQLGGETIECLCVAADGGPIQAPSAELVAQRLGGSTEHSEMFLTGVHDLRQAGSVCAPERTQDHRGADQKNSNTITVAEDWNETHGSRLSMDAIGRERLA